MLKWLRLFIVFILIILVSLLSLLILLFIPFSTNKVQILGRLFGVPIMKILGIEIIIEGAEKLGAHHPCIYISNHQTSLDLFIIATMVPKHTVSLGKKSLKWIPLFGQVYWFTGNILIDRANQKRAFTTMLKVAQEILEKKVSVWIFPEGTRSKSRGLLPFKKGAFYTAIQIQRPIVPIIFNSYDTSLNLNRFKAGAVHIRILDPIPTKGRDRQEIVTLKETCFELIKNNLHDLNQKAIQEQAAT